MQNRDCTFSLHLPGPISFLFADIHLLNKKMDYNVSLACYQCPGNLLIVRNLRVLFLRVNQFNFNHAHQKPLEPSSCLYNSCFLMSIGPCGKQGIISVRPASMWQWQQTEHAGVMCDSFLHNLHLHMDRLINLQVTPEKLVLHKKWE